MSNPSQIIKETKQFTKGFNKLVGEDKRKGLHQYLADNPEAGVIIKGGGGVRKLRWARPGGGKSGGVRIIYYFWSEEAPLFLLTLFAKNEQENLSKREINELAEVAQMLRVQEEGEKR